MVAGAVAGSCGGSCANRIALPAVIIAQSRHARNIDGSPLLIIALRQRWKKSEARDDFRRLFTHFTSEGMLSAETAGQHGLRDAAGAIHHLRGERGGPPAGGERRHQAGSTGKGLNFADRCDTYILRVCGHRQRCSPTAALPARRMRESDPFPVTGKLFFSLSLGASSLEAAVA